MSFPNPLWLSDLVGGFNHLEKYEFVNGKDDIPYMKREIKFMFETTNQRLKLVYSFSNGQFVQDSKDPNLTHRESNFWANSDRFTLRKNWKQTTFVDKPLSNHHLWMLETSLVSLPLNSWLCAEKKNDQALLIARSVEDPQKSEQKTGAFIGEHDDHLAHQLIGIQILP